MAVIKNSPIFQKFPSMLVPFSQIRNHICMMYIILASPESLTFLHLTITTSNRQTGLMLYLPVAVSEHLA